MSGQNRSLIPIVERKTPHPHETPPSPPPACFWNRDDACLLRPLSRTQSTSGGRCRLHLRCHCRSDHRCQQRAATARCSHRWCCRRARGSSRRQCARPSSLRCRVCPSATAAIWSIPLLLRQASIPLSPLVNDEHWLDQRSRNLVRRCARCHFGCVSRPVATRMSSLGSSVLPLA